jgi:hypothetical protein
MAFPFINNTGKSKITQQFRLNNVDYECTIYILPIKTAQMKNEIINYFGNRRYKEKLCLDITPEIIKQNLKTNNVSAYIIVQPVGIDNVASASLQIYDWCYSQKQDNITDADVWVGDVCRVANGTNNGGNPLKGLFYVMEQLIVQNLNKTNIKLYIDPEPDNVAFLKPKYESFGFIKNFKDNSEICPNWNIEVDGEDSAIVMEKTGLVPETSVIDFSFLLTKPEGSNKKRTYSMVKGGRRRKKIVKLTRKRK